MCIWNNTNGEVLNLLGIFVVFKATQIIYLHLIAEQCHKDCSVPGYAAEGTAIYSGEY